MTGGKHLTSQQRRAFREQAERTWEAAGFVPDYPGQSPEGQQASRMALERGLVTEAEAEAVFRARLERAAL